MNRNPLTWVSFYSTRGLQHGRKPTNIAIILQHSRFPTWKLMLGNPLPALSRRGPSKIAMFISFCHFLTQHFFCQQLPSKSHIMLGNPLAAQIKSHVFLSVWQLNLMSCEKVAKVNSKSQLLRKFLTSSPYFKGEQREISRLERKGKKRERREKRERERGEREKMSDMTRCEDVRRADVRLLLL